VQTLNDRLRHFVRYSNLPRNDLLEALPEAVVCFDETGLVLEVNSLAEHLFGNQREGMLGMLVEDLVVGGLPLEAAESAARPGAAGASPTTVIGRRGDGTRIGLDMRAGVQYTEHGQRVVATFRPCQRDSDRDSALFAYRATHPEWVAEDRPACLSSANDDVLQLLGHGSQGLLGPGFAGIAPELGDASLEDVLEPLELVQTVDRARTETARRTAAVESAIQSERERIARDLHDTVLQRIFAAGMALKTLTPQLSQPVLAGEAARIVDQLDLSIAEIRSALRQLSPINSALGGSLRSRVMAVLAEERHILGVTPCATFVGDISGTAQWNHEVLAVLRELLSNVARHAQAGTVEVDIHVDERECILRVSDDGVGFDSSGPTEGRGVANITQRVRDLGGSLRFRRRSEGGTLAECILPLSVAVVGRQGRRADIG
jgi:PAS domain S-box-containing protein